MPHKAQWSRGPYFEFLTIGPDEDYRDRRGRVQRIVGIRPEYYRRAGSLRVSDAIVSLAADSFRRSCPTFNFWGDTAYRGHALALLAEALADRLAAIQAADDQGMFELLSGSLLEHSIRRFSRQPPDWREIQAAIAGSLADILRCALRAQREGGTLLVLGI